jgi:galactokinase
LHFFAENRRVAAMRAALQAGDLNAYFTGVLSSGRSSFCYLQNVYTTQNVSEQGLSLALCVTQGVLAGKTAAFRVHGGGFAGTIQAFVKKEDVACYRAAMDALFGEGATMELFIRPVGAVQIVL